MGLLLRDVATLSLIGIGLLACATAVEDDDLSTGGTLGTGGSHSDVGSTGSDLTSSASVTGTTGGASSTTGSAPDSTSATGTAGAGFTNTAVSGPTTTSVSTTGDGTAAVVTTGASSTDGGATTGDAMGGPGNTADSSATSTSAGTTSSGGTGNSTDSSVTGGNTVNTSASTGSGGASATSTTSSATTSSGTSAGSNTLPWFDDFESGTLNAVAGGWTPASSAAGWVLLDGGGTLAYGPTSEASNRNLTIADGTDWSDLVFEADVRLGPSGDTSTRVYLIARAVPAADKYDYYFMRVRGDGLVRMGSYLNGTTTEFDSNVDGGALEANTWHRMRFTLNGNSLSVAWDGTHLNTVTASDLSSGAIGLGVDQGIAQFDNVSVTQP